MPKKIQDIKGPNNPKYGYVKGKKFKSRRHLDGGLRMLVVGFLIVLAINTINIYYDAKSLQINLTGAAKEGYVSLVDGGKTMNFSQAITVFEQAEQELWFINKDDSTYFGNSNIGQSVKSGFSAGKHIAIAGQHSAEALEIFQSIPKSFAHNNSNQDQKSASITDTLKQGLEKTKLAIAEINLASQEINDINERTLPTELQAQITLAKEKVREVTAFLNKTATHFPSILKLLGDRYPHRYLILLQNDSESRPTGGFIGSYMIVDINDGYIEKFETNDVYDIDGSYGGYIEPPDELKSFTQNWRLRDSNYSPDFFISGAKASWFLQKEGGPSVDTVIAVNQSLLRDLLEITGPIPVGSFGELNSKNYDLILSYIIESKSWGADDPKHILKSFIPGFKDSILREENLTKISSELFQAVQQKQIMMYSNHQDIQALFDSFSLSGRTYQNDPNEDYISVINISTSGNKSDQFIEEKINHHTQISKNGELINTLKLTRTHLWSPEVHQQWLDELGQFGIPKISEEILYVLGQGRNRSNIRIYVPEGSELLGASTRNVIPKQDRDLGKTYFYTSLEVDAGKSSSVEIQYKLPFKLDFDPVAEYKIIAEKQPGGLGSIFTKTMSSDKDLENIKNYPQDTIHEADSSITYASNLTFNRYFTSLWAKK